MAKITINGQKLKVKNGTTILNAAESLGYSIPTLCFMEEINEIGFCRVCLVEVEGEQDLVSACNTEVANGMVIETESEKVLQARKTTLALLASRHRFDCWRCPKDGNCEFYDLLRDNDVVFEEFGPGIGRNPEQIFGTGISQDQSKCILCKRCVAVCSDVVTAKVLKFRDDDGTNPTVSPTVGLEFDDAGCIFCGQCVKVCPTGTLHETDHIKEVESLLNNGKKRVYAQVSPAVRVSLAEEFGYKIGTPVSETNGKVNQALQMLGFDLVTDMNLGKNIAIMEESTELVNRINTGGQLPMFSSSCPAWIRYVEMYQPEYLENVSTVKSPHVLQGAMIKGFYGSKVEDSPEDIAVVSILPCTASKENISRKEMENDGVRDVDAVLTVRELAKMIKRAGIDFRRLDDLVLQNPLKEFAGASKGVTEATIKTAYEVLEGEPLSSIDYRDIKGVSLNEYEGTIKEATIQLKKSGKKLNVAQVYGGAAIKQMFELLKSSKKQYDYIEVMACQGGCLNGGGMPVAKDLTASEVVALRKQGLAQPVMDQEENDNQSIQRIYEEFLQEPKSPESYKYCHTHYTQKAFTKE